VATGPKRKRPDLRAEFVLRGVTVTVVAERVGISRGHLSDILHGRAGMTERLARDISLRTGIPMTTVEPELQEAAV
jgi:plasmid maintenance system antidote protein VapI